MNKSILAVALVIALGMGSTAYAGITPQTVNVSATVNANTSFTAVVHNTNLAGAVQPSLDFGILAPNASGNLTSTTTKDIVLTVNTQGLGFDISATGTVLTNAAGNTLPAGACVVTNAYVPADNGNIALPTGAIVQNAASRTWVGTNIPVYHSQNATVAAPVAQTIIEAFPGITDDPAAGSTAAVLSGQPTGTYTGTIVYTVTTR